MKSIVVYDEDAQDIDAICDEKDIQEAELIAALVEAIRNGDIDIDDYV